MNERRVLLFGNTTHALGADVGLAQGHGMQKQDARREVIPFSWKRPILLGLAGFAVGTLITIYACQADQGMVCFPGVSWWSFIGAGAGFTAGIIWEAVDPSK